MRRQRDPSKLSVAQSGWATVLPGLLALSVGVFLVVFVWGAEGEEADKLPKYLVIPFGLWVVFQGLSTLLVRKGVVLDKRQRTITTCRGLFVRRARRTVPLADGGVVAISREKRGSGKHAHVVYPVKVQSEDGPVEVEAPTKFLAARRRAEEVADFLGIGIEDKTVVGGSVREAGAVHDDLRERIRRSEDTCRLPDVPRGCRIVGSSKGARAVFDLPCEGFGVDGIVMLLIGAGVVAATVTVIVLAFPSYEIRTGDMESAYAIFALMGAIGGLFFLVAFFAILSALRKARGHHRVTVDSQRLAVDWTALAERRSDSMRLGNIEEIGIWPVKVLSVFGPKNVVVVRGKSKMLEFGRRLTEAERIWLRDALRAAVALQPDHRLA